MNRYTCYCTEEQTRKALELGAPIIVTPEEYKEDAMHFQMYLNGENASIVLPTAEQMIGWLLERIDDINVCKKSDGTWFYLFYPDNTIAYHFKEGYSSHKEATLAAIDAALDYLMKKEG